MNKEQKEKLLLDFANYFCLVCDVCTDGNNEVVKNFLNDKPERVSLDLIIEFDKGRKNIDRAWIETALNEYIRLLQQKSANVIVKEATEDDIIERRIYNKFLEKKANKPERVKKVFEFEGVNAGEITVNYLQELCPYLASISVTEVTDKADCTNPTPEREGLNVRIEYDYLDKKNAVSQIKEALVEYFTEDVENLSVKEIGAGNE